MMEVVEVKEVDGFPDYYVLEDGRVLGKRGQFLKYDVNSCGYRRVTFSHKGASSRKFVHHIVAEAFLGPRPPGAVVNHVDGDRKNNRASNLEWVTPSENVKDGYSRGRHNPNRYDFLTVMAIKALYQEGWSIKKISSYLGRDRNTVAKYAKGDSYA